MKNDHVINAKDYWREVDALAHDALAEAKKEGRDVDDVVFGFVDGHRWVIYYVYHHQVLQHTDADVGDEMRDFGATDGSKTWEEMVSLAVYLAMSHDVMECVRQLQGIPAMSAEE